LFSRGYYPDEPLNRLMTTPLTKPLKRELQIQGRSFVVTLSPEGIKLTLKGKRKGQELRWEDLVSGEAALAVALNASLKEIPERSATTTAAQTGDDADQSLQSNSGPRDPNSDRGIERKSATAPKRARSGRRR
jgi:hypothetical protein